MRVEQLDHLVLTVQDLEETSTFYSRVLGMTVVDFDGRKALAFGSQKINLHKRGSEFTPHAGCPLPGSADLCFLTSAPPETVVAHCHEHGIEIIDGPVLRTGATGPITSVYIRDPDGNLIEIAVPHQPDSKKENYAT